MVKMTSRAHVLLLFVPAATSDRLAFRGLLFRPTAEEQLPVCLVYGKRILPVGFDGKDMWFRCDWVYKLRG